MVQQINGLDHQAVGPTWTKLKRMRISIKRGEAKGILTSRNASLVKWKESKKKMEQHMWASVVGPTLASLMFFLAMAHRYLPYNLQSYLSKYATRIFTVVYPFIEIKIHEYGGDRLKRSEAYVAIQAYLMATTAQRARKLKAEVGKDSTNLVLSMDENEQVTDEFREAKLWWTSRKTTIRSQTISFPPREEERRYYKLVFHRRHRQLILDHYLRHVMEEGKIITVQSRRRKLYMNNRGSEGGYGRAWSHIVFEHPATFHTLAMDPDKKKAIIQDLVMFSKAKDYYAKIGKAWKRGYLLYGPPGTGKSTMVAAMANFLEYDVYDLELTAVKDNTELRKLLIEITSKSIVVIEDIDCSLDLSGRREKKVKKPKDNDQDEKKLRPEAGNDDSSSKVTLSGLLNFIDGLWSACGGERLIVFTTNHLEKLDPALIRRGRMDKHIKLSYCSFNGFKVLAKNYLDLDSHPLFDDIRRLMEEAKITPADVAENLMPKSSILTANENAEACIENLIQALHKAKEEEVQKAKEEALQLQDTSNQEPTATATENSDALQDGSRQEPTVPAAENGDTIRKDKGAEETPLL